MNLSPNERKYECTLVRSIISANDISPTIYLKRLWYELNGNLNKPENFFYFLYLRREVSAMLQIGLRIQDEIWNS